MYNIKIQSYETVQSKWSEETIWSGPAASKILFHQLCTLLHIISKKKQS